MRRPSMVEEAAAPPEPDRVEGAPHPRETAALHGQDAAERAFLDAWRGGRMHHAWMLAGPRGVGKATLAWRIARALIAQPPAGDGTGAPRVPDTLDMDPQSPVFRRVAALGEPRLKLLRRGFDDKRKKLRTRIVVDDARAMMELFHQTAADGGWRVAIVDPVDEMNASAANALLKLIEEPPRDSMFLLVSHAPAKLLPTIRSRCRRLDLRPLGVGDLARAVGLDPDAAGTRALAALSGGSAGEALRLAALDGPKLYADLVRLIGGAPGMDRAQLHRLAESCAGRDAEPRLDATIRLTSLLLARLARAAATGAVGDEAAPGEAALAARLGSGPARARIWADAAQAFETRAAHALAVNLDPAQIILDTFLALDAAAGRALSAA